MFLANTAMLTQNYWSQFVSRIFVLQKKYIGAYQPLTLVPNSRAYFLSILLLKFSAQLTGNFSH